MAFPCAIPGINLTDYGTQLPRAGWPGPCAGTYVKVLINDAGAAVTVEAGIAELVGLIMRANERDGYHYRPADTGAYNCRKIAGSTAWSLHAYGLALDTNWNTNPQARPLKTDQPEWVIRRWNRYGFAWGGHYLPPTLPDTMHEEFMGTPAQAAELTILARQELAEKPPVPPKPPGVEGEIAAVYNGTPGLKELLGAPLTPELTTPDGRGRYNHFANGCSIYWTPECGAFAVLNGIRAAWEKSGWERGPLGYPTSNEFAVTTTDRWAMPSTWQQSNFEHGYIRWHPATGAVSYT